MARIFHPVDSKKFKAKNTSQNLLKLYFRKLLIAQKVGSSEARMFKPDSHMKGEMGWDAG